MVVFGQVESAEIRDLLALSGRMDRSGSSISDALLLLALREIRALKAQVNTLIVHTQAVEVNTSRIP
jgi:hypothetical protein